MYDAKTKIGSIGLAVLTFTGFKLTQQQITKMFHKMLRKMIDLANAMYIVKTPAAVYAVQSYLKKR